MAQRDVDADLDLVTFNHTYLVRLVDDAALFRVHHDVQADTSSYSTQLVAARLDDPRTLAYANWLWNARALRLCAAFSRWTVCRTVRHLPSMLPACAVLSIQSFLIRERPSHYVLRTSGTVQCTHDFDQC